MSLAADTERHRTPGPILERGQASTRVLTLVTAVMVYLAVLALASLILVERAVETWSRGLTSEATVQIRDDSSRDIEKDVATVLEILLKTPGVVSAAALDRRASEDLLAPWIGSEGLDQLPIPRLVRVMADSQNPPDFAALEKRLQDKVPVATVDTHRRWEEGLRRMAGTIITLSKLALALIALCAMTMVVFAVRAVLDANKPMIDVLYLAGADDNFIANQFNVQFIISGLWSGVLGLLLGALTLFAFGYTGGAETNSAATATRTLFHVPKSGEWQELLVFMLVPLAAMLLSVATARIALMRMLRDVR